MFFDNMVKFSGEIKINKGKKEFIGRPNNWQNLRSSVGTGKHYGILTGEINDILVVDLDRTTKEKELNTVSFESLLWFENNICKLNECNTFITKTINGGYHIYFKYSDKISGKQMKCASIDILSNKSCCYQGEGYDILYENEIRSLTTKEIDIISKNMKEIKDNIEKIKKTDTCTYKKMNVVLKRDENVNWNSIKTNNGYKVVPKCKLCLVSDKEHTHDEHSALFINNNDNSVIKTCYSCGSENMNKVDSKKIINIFNMIMNITNQENSVYQDLVKNLLKVSKEYNYKREKYTGVVYKQVKPYAYIKHLEPMDFLNEMFLIDHDFKSNVNNMDNMIKFMKQYDDPNFPFIKYDKDYIGFSNGVLNVITCEFTDIPDSSLVVNKYFDLEFNETTDTPLFDKILDYQFNSETRDFIYMCLGRMFGIRDNYGFMLYLLGEPGCGKSLIIDILSECFNNVGAIGNSFEEKFGLSFLYDRDIIVCDDLPKNISKIFPQQTFQTCVTGGKIPVAVKGGNGFTVDWNVPMLWAGNWFPDYIDKGQISRRMFVANFEKNVVDPDPTLKSRILSTELPQFIYKSLLYYKKLTNYNGKKDIWSLCPEYFLDQQQDLKIERNPLYKFLLENTKYKEGNIILLEDIRNNFNRWLGKNVKSLDNGTFFQVNKEYIIEQMVTCKHCSNKHIKDCCVLYNRTQRSTKKTIKNIEFVNVDYIPE